MLKIDRLLNMRHTDVKTCWTELPKYKKKKKKVK